MKPAAIFDLSARAKFRLRGADRVRFLNGQVSNDVRKATENSAVRACVLSVKGKIQAEIFVAADGDWLLLDTDAELREALPLRLERYIIADDVQIEDVTDEFALLHAAEAEIFPVAKRVQCARFGFAGNDFWLPLAKRDEALREREVWRDDEMEIWRIEQSLPRWGCELSEEILPPEANLEASAIDYAKGCYIGQEVISRMKMSGQTNKRLCGLVSLGGEPLQNGMRLTSDGADAGWITSAIRSARLEKEIALAFVKRSYQQADADLRAGPESLPVRIVALPFAKS